jgi:hypothetical protein
MLSTVAVVAPLLLGGCILGLFLPILRSICRRAALEEITPEWLDNFSVAAYYPMQGLLSDEDFTFLCSQPGFDVSLYKKLRRERLAIFRQYLLRLILDFNRLHAVARLILSRSAQDRSDAVAGLIRLKFRFSVAVFQAECSYLLCQIGFQFLATQRVIAALEDMNLQLGTLFEAQASLA